MYDRKDYRLASMPSAQCHVRFYYSDGELEEVWLVSYNTTVIVISGLNTSNPYWGCSGVYSKTTARHINRFTSEFLGENLYQTAKNIAMTGEVIELDEAESRAVHQQVAFYEDGFGGRKFFGNY